MSKTPEQIAALAAIELAGKLKRYDAINAINDGILAAIKEVTEPQDFRNQIELVGTPNLQDE